VNVVQTHISFVAIAPPLVFKVKKAVDLGFLDFTTVAKRRRYCEEEVRLNRRLCHSVYEGVVPIVEDAATASGLRFGTEDELDHPDVVEYAVRMKQLPTGFFMVQMLESGSLTDEHLERVARKLTEFYRRHPATEASSVWGSPERIRLSIDENFAQIEGHAGVLISEGALAALREDAELYFQHETHQLERRVQSGMIRDCHGDLHLEHIHITPDRICIYDCIEFNARFRYIDVANDIAFLAMDLDYHGRPDLSAGFVRQMQDAMEDPDLQRMTPFYKTYRAIVRAKVQGMKSGEPEVPDAERAAAAAAAKAHYRLATHYAVTGDRPMLVVVMGRVASGKSTHAQALSSDLGWPLISSDETRKRLAGVPLHQRGDEAARADLYSDGVSKRTYAALLEGARSELLAGRSVILDATFGRRRDRDALRRAIAEAQTPEGTPVRCCLVELVASDELLRERLRLRESQTGLTSDARLSDFDKVDALYEPPDEDEAPWLSRVQSDADEAATSRRILSELVRTRYGESA